MKVGSTAAATKATNQRRTFGLVLRTPHCGASSSASIRDPGRLDELLSVVSAASAAGGTVTSVSSLDQLTRAASQPSGPLRSDLLGRLRHATAAATALLARTPETGHVRWGRRVALGLFEASMGAGPYEFFATSEPLDQPRTSEQLCADINGALLRQIEGLEARRMCEHSERRDRASCATGASALPGRGPPLPRRRRTVLPGRCRKAHPRMGGRARAAGRQPASDESKP